MTPTIVLFPLASVVFPTEKLPLHVSEPRYQKLIEDCRLTAGTFGVPILMNNQLEYGTEVAVEEVVEYYQSGALDVILKGLRVFKLLKVLPEEQGQPFTRGRIEFVRNIENGTAQLRKQYIDLVRELYLHLEIPPPDLHADQINSFTMSHKIGLAQDQEFLLVKLKSEKERFSFLINHLILTIPIVQEMNRTKMTIEMNGHFRDFNPLDFEDYKI